MGPFLFVMPLFYAFKKENLSFSQGFLWGIFFWFIHSFGIFYVVFYEGAGLFRLIFPLVFVFYCSLFSGLWFVCLAHLKKYSFTNWLFLGITFCYFWFVDSLILSPFGRVQGYPLAFPLIPIMKFPELLFLVSSLGKWGMLLFLMAFQISFVKGFSHHKWFILSIICILPFLSGLFLTPQTYLPAWVQKIHFEPLDNTIHPHERAQHLVAKLTNLKTIKLFVLPESYFPFVINKKSNSLRVLQKYILQDKQHIIFGANQLKDNKLLNCALLVNKCRIIHSYEKSHLIPFFEYNPYTMKQIGLFFNFFLHKGNPFYCADRHLSSFEIPEFEPFMPLICSELFWLKSVPSNVKGILLCLSKDSYFGSSGYSEIMLLSAQFTALCQKRFLAYCASSSAYFINQYGKILKKI